MSRLKPGDLLLSVAVALGLFGIFDLLAWQAAALVTVAAAVLVGLSIWATCWRPLTIVLGLLAALMVGVLALVGFDVTLNFALKAVHYVNSLDDVRIPVWFGLILALAELTAAAGWYLHRVRFPNLAAVGAGAGFALVAVIGLPLVLGAHNAGTSKVSRPGPVPSRLNMLIVTDGSHRPPPAELPANPALGEFTVNYSVGVAVGDSVRWTLVESDSEREALIAAAAGSGRSSAAAPPTAAGQGDSVLVLLVDGSDPVVVSPAELPDRPPQPGEVQRWTQVAAAAALAPETPTFALLQSTDPTRLQQWKGWQAGTAVSLQALESQAVTDAAFRLAVAAPESDADYLLAVKYRPILLFDRGEQVPWPLSINTIFREGRVRLCRNEGLRTDCPSEPILNPNQLENGSTSLNLDLPKSKELQKRARQELQRLEAEAAPEVGGKAEASVPEGTPPAGTVETTAAAATPLGAGSTIYVHPVALEGRKLLYLDYWWYLPDNPVELGGGALCGAGFVIAGLTCDNHQSDWEGMTVVLGMGGAEPQLVAVQYAQHDSIVRYSWQDLRSRWDRSPVIAKLVAGIDGADSRPLAFIARGTHATYPIPCGNCGQVKRWALGEEPHRGDLPWIGDYSSACGHASCLQLLPTHARGTEPASWNAYENPWGELDCFLVYYCDSGTPPRSPGQQGRYEHPARYNQSLSSVPPAPRP
ncbi:MAG: hypothetical protein ACM3Q9_01895 [Methanosarcina sp.]